MVPCQFRMGIRHTRSMIEPRSTFERSTLNVALSAGGPSQTARLNLELVLAYGQLVCGIVVFLLFADFAVAASGDPSAVLARYQQMLARQPREGAVFDKVCQLYEDQGGLQGMLRAYQQMAQKSPRDAMPHLILGHIHKRQNDFPKALRSYQQAEKLAPRDANTYLVAGQLLVAMKRPDEAVNHLEMAVGLESSLEQRRTAQRMRGECYWELGELDAAVDTWQKIAEENPEDLFTRIELA